MNEEIIKKVATVLNGIIFKKAELDGNMVGVYSEVLKRVNDFEDIEGEEILSVLGETGG